MSKSIHGVLDEYTGKETSVFNNEIELYLNGSKYDAETLKKAVAYFYLLANKLEEESAYFAKVQYHELQSLEGKVLTLLDAILSDKEQKKAAKDMFRQQFWYQWVDGLSMKKEPESPTGMPIEV